MSEPIVGDAVRRALAGRRVLIAGIGREGTAVAHLADRLAASVTAYSDEALPLAGWQGEWGDRIPVAIGEEHAAGLEERVDVVVASPGMSPTHPLLTRMRDRGIEVTTGTGLWMRDHAAAVTTDTVAVTGSKGKSTTSSLIHHLETALHGPAELGGNIGVPLLQVPPARRYVLELSSYQCSALDTSPDTVVLTSLFPEHLDWHGSVERYYSDKLNLVAHGPRRVIANATDDRLVEELRRMPTLTIEWVGRPDGLHVAAGWFMLGDTRLFPRDTLTLRGEHNGVNACLALATVSEGIDLIDDSERVANALRSFSPLEHRLEEIPDASGLTFVDDSLSTSPYAAIEAMRAFSERPVTLLVGGADRGVDYRPLADYLGEHPAALVVGLPGSGERLARLMPDEQPVAVASDMVDAVAIARRGTPPGGIILLSPAAPSYGVYRNFAERAADFRAAIAATVP